MPFFLLKGSEGGGGEWKILKTKLHGRKSENKFPAERKLI